MKYWLAFFANSGFCGNTTYGLKRCRNFTSQQEPFDIFWLIFTPRVVFFHAPCLDSKICLCGSYFRLR